MKNKLILLLCFLASLELAKASISVTVAEPQSTGSKAIVKLTMKNTSTNAVESARAVVFLLDDQGKVVGQRAEWVVGGTKEKPGLAANGTTVFNMVLPADKPFNKAKVTFT